METLATTAILFLEILIVSTQIKRVEAYLVFFAVVYKTSYYPKADCPHCMSLLPV